MVFLEKMILDVFVEVGLTVLEEEVEVIDALLHTLKPNDVGMLQLL